MNSTKYFFAKNTLKKLCKSYRKYYVFFMKNRLHEGTGKS